MAAIIAHRVSPSKPRFHSGNSQKSLGHSLFPTLGAIQWNTERMENIKRFLHKLINLLFRRIGFFCHGAMDA